MREGNTNLSRNCDDQTLKKLQMLRNKIKKVFLSLGFEELQSAELIRMRVRERG